ncbi:hypothetical protein MTO96_012243 [Rhipicephalus appendiculatus]
MVPVRLKLRRKPHTNDTLEHEEFSPSKHEQQPVPKNLAESSASGCGMRITGTPHSWHRCVQSPPGKCVDGMSKLFGLVVISHFQQQATLESLTCSALVIWRFQERALLRNPSDEVD